MEVLGLIANSTTAVILLILAVFGLVFYLMLVFKPELIATTILTLFDFFLPANRYPATSFWILLNQLKFRRRLMILLLVTICLGLGIADIYFLGQFINSPISDKEGINLVIIAGFFVYTLLNGRQLLKIGSIELPEISHPKERVANQIAENLSLAAGCKKPDIKIVGSTNPTAFAIAKFGEYPAIYLTTQLLYLTSDLELEAVIGHELSHIVSKRSQDFLIISVVTYGLKITSYFFFILLLLIISPLTAALWVSFIASISIRTLRFIKSEEVGEYQSGMSYFLTLANPPYVLTNFVVVLAYYFFTGDEDIYADLMSVQLNRYTGGLYSILEKLQSFDEIKQRLPVDLAYLYFNKEAATKNSFTLQPDTQTRLDVLASVDSLVSQIEPNTTQSAAKKCPYCQHQMIELSVPTQYKTTVKIDRCPVCLGAWFDDREMWVVADLATLNPNQENLSLSLSNQKPLICPKCEVELQLLKRPSIPNIFQIFECPVCKGNFMHPKEISTFGFFRKKWLADQKSQVSHGLENTSNE